MNKIEVYKFVKVKQLVYQLIKLYRTNDMNSHKTQKDFLLNEINDIFKEKDIDISDFITSIDDVKLTKKKAEHLLNELKVYIQDFEIPSSSQLEKIFRKVKKLKRPDINLIDTKEISYLGWNDNSSNRKYIVYKNLDDKFEGIYGEISPNKTKHNKSSGTYTKKGDYICYDSFKCNQNLDDINNLYEFIVKIK